METLQLWSLQLIVAWQTAVPSLAAVMHFFTFLGKEEFYLLVMPAFYWSFNPAWGVQLAVMLLASNVVNAPLKLAFHLPRPYWVDPTVQALSTETTYGVPSAHAQNALAVWGLLAARVGRPWALGLAGVVIVLISISRIYLGMHFLHDTVVGWLVGALLLAAFFQWAPAAAAWWRQLGFWRQVGLALVLAMLNLAVNFGILLALANTPDPASWATQALAASGEAIAPRDWEGPVTMAGMIFGAGLSFALLAQRPGFYFSVEGSVIKRVMRYGLGLVGVIMLWGGLAQIFPTDPPLLAAAFRFLRYTLILWWVLYFAPLIFERASLIDPARGTK